MFAMSFSTLAAQLIVTVIVVALYHVWVSSGKSEVPPPPVSHPHIHVPPPSGPTPAAPKPEPAPVAVAPVPVPAPVVLARSSDEVEPEIAAVIAAAVALVLARPHRVLAVQQVTVPVPHLNVWAWEGRTQLFMSHKIR